VIDSMTALMHIAPAREFREFGVGLSSYFNSSLSRQILRRTQLLDWPPEPKFDGRTTALRGDTGAAVVALLLLGTAIPLILMAGTIVEKTVVGFIRQGAADHVRITTSAASASP